MKCHVRKCSRSFFRVFSNRGPAVLTHSPTTPCISMVYAPALDDSLPFRIASPKSAVSRKEPAY